MCRYLATVRMYEYVCIIYFDKSMHVHITAAALVWHRPAALVIHGRKFYVFPSFSEKLCKSISHPEALDSTVYTICINACRPSMHPIPLFFCIAALVPVSLYQRASGGGDHPPPKLVLRYVTFNSRRFHWPFRLCSKGTISVQ